MTENYELALIMLVSITCASGYMTLPFLSRQMSRQGASPSTERILISFWIIKSINTCS